MQLQPADLIGAFYADDSLLWSAQDCVNWLPTVAMQKGTRTEAKLATPPGLSYFTQCGVGPIRGARDVEGKLFVVSGNELYEVAYDGTPTLRGTIPGVGLVSMSHNKRGYGNQLLIVNGDAGYVWDTSASTLTKITDEGYPGAVMVDYLDHYLIQVEPWGRFWFHSNLDNATDYNTLDRYDPEASTDKIKAIAANQLEAVTFSQKTIEFFANTGAATDTFQSKRIVIERGCASRHTIVKLDNTLMWLGNDGIFYRLNGYGAQPISTGPIHKAIAGLDWENAFGFVWEDKGYKVAYWTFPDGQTWGYDATQPAGYQWHRRKSYGLNRWRLNTCTAWQGRNIGGDYRTGVLYLIDWDAQHEMGRPLVSERTGGTANANQNAVICPYVELIFDTGGPAWDGDSGLVTPGLTLSGDLPGGVVGTNGTLQYAGAGGVAPRTFSIASGSLPSGATMDASGLVTYNYNTGGSYSWTVRVTDADEKEIDLADTAVVSDPSDAWFISSPGGSGGDVYSGKYSGDVWTAEAFTPQPGFVYYFNSEVHVSQLSGNSYSVSANRGTSWSSNTTPSTSGGGGRMAEGGGYYFRCGGISQIQRRTTASMTWSEPAASNSLAETVVVQNSKVIVAYPSGVTCSVSSNWATSFAAAGTIWDDAFPHSVRFATNGTRLCALYSHGDGGATPYGTHIKVSDNDGSAFSAIKYTFPSPGVGNTAGDIISLGDGRWLAGTTGGALAYSSDDGETWTLCATTLAGGVRQMAKSSTGRVLIACTGGFLYSTDDYGVTVQLRTDPVGVDDIYGVAWAL